MAAHRMRFGLVAAVTGLIAAQSAVSAQEHRGTAEQQMACTPDVFRLCGAEIPDTNRIVGCLRQNVALLSRPCRAVFESNTANSQSAPPQQAVPRSRAVLPGPNGSPPYQDDDDDDE